MDAILDLGAEGQLAALANRQVSAEELMRATLARIARRNPAVNAVVCPRDPEALLAEARAADAATTRGPLHGLPMAIKDLANVCLLYTSPSPRDRTRSRMPSSA